MNEDLVLTEEGLQIIKDSEGFRMDAYLCPAGIATIGWGSTYYANGNKVKLGESITREQADDELLFEINRCIPQIKSVVKVPLNNNQLSALVSFVYNLGIGKFSKSTLLRKLNKGDYDGAANEFIRWTKAGGVVLPGLVKRRDREKSLFLS